MLIVTSIRDIIVNNVVKHCAMDHHSSQAPRSGATLRKYQSKIYNFLERPTGKVAFSYHILVFCLVFLCLGLSVFSTIKEYEEEAGEILFKLEIIIVVWFSLELIIRCWGAGCRSRYQGWMGRLRFLKSPFCLIDVVTIGASVIVLSGHGDRVYAASALRGLRFFQILRMVRMDRRGGTWKLLGSVVYAHRQELLTTLYIGFLVLMFSSFIIYLVEKDENPEDFESFAHALWWGFITVCTVGYGDSVPKTWKGKVIACICALFGISFFALPAGILGSGFALKVQQQQRQKHMIRRRGPAATLIQSLWRCYAASVGHDSIATWKIHLNRSQRSPSSVKTNTSILTRMSTIRRPKHSRSPARDSNKNKIKMSNLSSDNLSHSCEDSLVNSQRNSETSIPIQKRNSDVNFLLEDDEDGGLITSLTTRHKGAIRAIRKLKYLVAKRKFKEALKPYDIKDVIESYSAGHSDLVFKVKGLQSRLDLILGRQGSKSKDVYESKTSLASRIVNVERVVDSIEEKLQLFMEMYQEDRKRFLETQQTYENIINVCGESEVCEAAQQNTILPIHDDNEPNLETFDGNELAESEELLHPEVSPDSDVTESRDCLLTPSTSPPPPPPPPCNSLPQGLELFSLVTERRQNNVVYRKFNSYNV